MQQQQNTTHMYVKYATLSEYFAEVMSLTQYTYPTNNGGDFFPLDEIVYWTVPLSPLPLPSLLTQLRTTASTYSISLYLISAWNSNG